MLQSFILNPDGSVEKSADPDALSRALRTASTRFWLDMEGPTEQEIALLDKVFGFHPLAIEDTIKHVQRPKIEGYGQFGDGFTRGYFYMVFHGPDLETFREKLRTREVDIFLSENYLVTVHDDPMPSISEVRARAAADARLVLQPGIDLLLHEILDRLVDNCQPILDFLDVELDRLEEEALGSPRQAVLSEIAQRKRDLLSLRRIVGPQREVLAQLTRGEVPFIRETTRIYMRDVLDHLNRTVETVELYRDLITGAHDIYLSSISNNLNNIMKTLTIISVVAMPLTVVTSFFGMNFEYIPGLHSPAAFWIAVVSMIAVVITLLVFFRRKRWL